MTDTSGCTLRQLLPDRAPWLGKAIEQAWDGAGKLPGVAISVAAERAEPELAEALNVDVFLLMAKAWAKAAELKAAADDADKSASQTATVVLGEHKLTAELHPTIEIRFARLGHLTVPLTLELAFDIDLARVTISKRRITRIGRTEGHASAVLKYKDVELPPRLKSKQLPLLDDFRLREPLPLPF